MSRNELDRVLDEALASYTACEPRAGLAGRVLARLESERRPRRWTWLLGVPAFAGMAVLLMMPRPQEPEPLRAMLPVPVIPQEAYERSRSEPAPPRIRPVPQKPLITLARIDPEVAQWLTRPLTPLEIGPVEIRQLRIVVV
jgi:hypothetical protein